jgi:citrate synthase
MNISNQEAISNVDFYSGIIYRALGIPTTYVYGNVRYWTFTGWIAQWKEMRENKEPIGRQIYWISVARL